MKCLSLIQPWATLILTGAKRFETRGWRTPYRGPLAIHASQKFPPLARNLVYKEPFKSVLANHGIDNWVKLVTGKLLGMATLKAVHRVEDVEPLLSHQELSFGDFSSGRWAWELELPMRLREPVPLKGALSLFEVAYPHGENLHV